MVPVWCVTPDTPRTIHRYHDTSPFSPSGRYLVSTQFPYEDRMPEPGSSARIIVTDLSSGTYHCVAETKGWDTQMGAHVHWGKSDDELLFNDLDTTTWTPFGVRLDLRSRDRTNFQGPIYSVSSDRKFAITPCLTRTSLALGGYGVIIPSERIPRTGPASEDDGLFIIDLTTGYRRLLISFRELGEFITLPGGRNVRENGELVGFHVQLHSQGTHALFIVRWIQIPSPVHKVILELYRRGARVGRKLGHLTHQNWVRWALPEPKLYARTLIVVPITGGTPKAILPASEFEKGAHHPTWCPDGDSVLMNCTFDGTLRFARYQLGKGHWELLSKRLLGSGHPAMHPNGRQILTDAYFFERAAYGDSTAPIRLIDLDTDSEQKVVRIRTKPNFIGPNKELRVDPHPAWNDSYTHIAFNAFADGTRRVYVADLSNLVS
jgi:hypothetical protein